MQFGKMIVIMKFAFSDGLKVMGKLEYSELVLVFVFFFKKKKRKKEKRDAAAIFLATQISIQPICFVSVHVMCKEKHDTSTIPDKKKKSIPPFTPSPSPNKAKFRSRYSATFFEKKIVRSTQAISPNYVWVGLFIISINKLKAYKIQ